MKINATDRKYLELWLRFLLKAAVGLSMNPLLTYRRPTNIVVSDACPKGLGGFSIVSGMVWRYELSGDLSIHSNVLEWLANVVTIWLEHIRGNVGQYGNVLAVSDITRAASDG